MYSNQNQCPAIILITVSSTEKYKYCFFSLLVFILINKSFFSSFVLIAEEQAQIQQVMDSLKGEVEKRDLEIRNLQRSLKDAETILVRLFF